MNDGPKAPPGTLGRLQGVQQGFRVHHVSVALAAPAGRRSLRRAGDVGDRLKTQFSVRVREQEAAALRGVGLARVPRDLLLGRGRDHGGGRYRSARSGKSVTTTPRCPLSLSSRATWIAPAAAAPALWPASRPSSRTSCSAVSQPRSVGMFSFRSNSDAL